MASFIVYSIYSTFDLLWDLLQSSCVKIFIELSKSIAVSASSNEHIYTYYKLTSKVNVFRMRSVDSGRETAFIDE